MNEIINTNEIETMIYEIRGVQVMLSSDVAKLYQVETRRINEVIKRNMNRFPKEFCFQLTKTEMEEISSRSQIAILNKNNNLRGYNVKYLPYVLTEQGIMMLSGLLKSDIAVKVNIQIIDAFVKMRKFFANNITSNKILLDLENRILKLENYFHQREEAEKINKIFFEGQIYDAYSLLLDILGKATREIIIFDNYAGKELLDILKKINIPIIIISKNIDHTLKEKYENQYKNITFMHNTSFHDRFIIIDRCFLYFCGSSFKDMGKKCFAIYENDIKEYLAALLSAIHIE